MADADQSRTTSSLPDAARLQPVPALVDVEAYATPMRLQPTDLYLDANEGPTTMSREAQEVIASIDAEVLRRYPCSRELEDQVARSFNVSSDQVLVTAGGDEAIDRLMRCMLRPGRSIVSVTPTFVMIDKSARRCGAKVISLPWADDGESFPVEDVLGAMNESTSVVTLVSPNNPTGTVVSFDDMVRVIERARVIGALVIADLAYVEFADDDPTSRLLAFDNVAVVRTFSKAWGLAGLRVGYTIAHERIITWMRAIGGPYPVSGLSLASASALWKNRRERARGVVLQIRVERQRLFALLEECGARPLPSHANFVTARFDSRDRAHGFANALAGLGISVRRFESDPQLERLVRITCPGDEDQFTRLAHAIRTALQPEAILFDLDGVIADVRESYRRAVIETCAAFGLTITQDDISEQHRIGNANNEWELSRRLLQAGGIDVSLDEVTETYQLLYLGVDGKPGLEQNERLIIDPAVIAAFRSRWPLAIVTGRPRDEAVRFLERFNLRPHFETLVCMEDGPVKPDPAPVRCALERLNVQRAWMIGDTVDDIRAARAAGVIAFGLLTEASGDAMRTSEALLRAGAADVIESVTGLLERLP